MLTLPPGLRRGALIAALVTASIAAPGVAVAGGHDGPIIVDTDNNGDAVETTVTAPGGQGGAINSVADHTTSAGQRGTQITCTFSYPEGDQLFQETRDGVDGRYYFVGCSDGSRSQDWFPDTAPPPPVGPRQPQVTAGQLAQQAVGRLPLPSPQVHHNPDAAGGRPQTVVGVDTWLWVDGTSYRRLTQTVAAGPVWATVTARPVSTYWRTGSADAADVRCAGPGVAYDSRRSPDGQSTYCSTVYRRSSASQPQSGPSENDRFFVGSATTRWQVSWVGAGGAAGQLPDLERTSSFRLAVAEVQSVNY